MKLKAFIYLLAREAVPFGALVNAVETVNALAKDGPIDYEDEHLEAWAGQMAARLSETGILVPIVRKVS